MFFRIFLPPPNVTNSAAIITDFFVLLFIFNHFTRQSNFFSGALKIFTNNCMHFLMIYIVIHSRILNNFWKDGRNIGLYNRIPKRFWLFLNSLNALLTRQFAESFNFNYFYVKLGKLDKC